MAKFKHDNSIVGYHVLRNEDMDQLHEAVLDLMEQLGVRIEGEEAREILTAAGCTLDRATGRVRFPRNLVNDAIESVPATFIAYGRGGRAPLKIGGKRPAYKCFSGAVSIVDPYTGEERATTVKDVADMARIMDALDGIDVVTLPVAGADVPAAVRTLYETEAIFTNCTKNFTPDIIGTRNIKRFIDMAAAVAGGYDQLRAKPNCLMAACPVSPLIIHEQETQIIMQAARAGIPVDVLSMALAGATGPVTLAGTLVVNAAEELAGITLAQLVRKGAPCLYGTCTTAMDMKTATTPLGSPEYALNAAAVAQLGHYYGIPTNVGGLVSDSKLPDYQIGLEKALTALSPAMAGASIIFGAGVFNMGLTMSFGDMVMDNEFISMFRRVCDGIEVDEDTIAKELIEEVGPQGQFLTTEHTLEYMRQEISSTKLIDRRMRPNWEADGGKTLEQACDEKALAILESYKPEPLPAEAAAKLRAIISEAEAEEAEIAAKGVR